MAYCRVSNSNTICNSLYPPLTDIILFRTSSQSFKTRQLGRGFHTLVRNASFPSPTNVESHRILVCMFSTWMSRHRCHSKGNGDSRWSSISAGELKLPPRGSSHFLFISLFISRIEEGGKKVDIIWRMGLDNRYKCKDESSWGQGLMVEIKGSSCHYLCMALAFQNSTPSLAHPFPQLMKQPSQHPNIESQALKSD